MVSVIIVNYKSARLLVECLASIYQHEQLQHLQLIVVDNNSGNEEEAFIKARFPAVRWHQMGYNAGFARANNVGIKLASHQIILLLNPDVLLESETIGICARRLAKSVYLACGVQLLNADGTPQISGSYFAKGGLNQLLPLPFLGRLMKLLGTWLNVKKPSIEKAETEVEIDWINGAFLMLKREAIQKAGHLDDDFFLYFEEIEWCARIRRHGKLCLYGDLNVIHLQGATANEVFGSADRGYYQLWDKKGKQILLSSFVRIRKQFGVFWFLMHLALYTLEIFLSPLVLLAHVFYSGADRYASSHYLGFLQNLFYLYSQSATIITNKPHFYKAND